MEALVRAIVEIVGFVIGYNLDDGSRLAWLAIQAAQIVDNPELLAILIRAYL